MSDNNQYNQRNTVELTLSDPYRQQAIFGPRNQFLKRIEDNLHVEIVARGETVNINGNEDDIKKAARLIEDLYQHSEDTRELTVRDIDVLVSIALEKEAVSARSLFSATIQFPKIKEAIRPRGGTQLHYIQQIEENDIVFGIGPAGTGKTYLAMAIALSHFYRRKVRRIILTRPAVEAGEKIGYLPGDMLEKVAPYLRPLYDALFDIVGKAEADMLIDQGYVEVANLGFMRGRTLNDSFVILDEAQNSTRAQMKMFLTRIGFESRAVITGDISQIDLPRRQESGLLEAIQLLRNINGIAFTEFSASDVVRHPLVKKIIAAYDKAEEQKDRTSH